jgi:glycerophosphoryl diester phosphodiesterase
MTRRNCWASVTRVSSPFSIVAKAAGSDEAAENTCEACAALAALTAPDGLIYALEVDVRLSADGVLVACHDVTLDRTTNGSGPVRARSLAELRSLTAGARGESIPTLDEVLEARGELELVIEVHDADREVRARLIEWLRKVPLRVRDALIVASELDVLVHAVRSAGLGVRTSATAGEALRKVLLERLRLERLATAGHHWLVPERHRGLVVASPRFVAAARARGDFVWVYVINEPTAAMRLRALGVNGVFTTRPRRLGALLGS